MASVAVYNIEGKEVEKLELNDSVFGVEINENLVHQAVLKQLANSGKTESAEAVGRWYDRLNELLEIRRRI